ncbi:M28 family peptidase [Aequorivita sp. SDUM287046]|uniref:M28 family peptidase n=1 Tax=Aequorivita aurantiaca TaxID=3053356 RepID=A0ABT8DP56_9FLAO|nr:M28 family peptidase [Aequorivita aurantiaca]MDN3724867.1 M28 family peptidase [Aequorivita aurantiaca]
MKFANNTYLYNENELLSKLYMKHFVIYFSLLLYTNLAISQTDKEKTESTITKNKIEGHIYFLADDLLKGRQTGTPENKIAASYLANTLRSYGVKPVTQSVMKGSNTDSYFQMVKLNQVSPIQRLLLSVDGKELKKKVAIKPSKMDFTGEAVYLGYGLENDYKNKNVTEKIIVIKSGGPNATDAGAAYNLIAQKEQLAKQHGAVAIIELVDIDETTWGYVDHSFNSERLELANDQSIITVKKELAYLWVHDENHIQAKAFEAKDKLIAKLKMDGQEKKTILSQNVIGMVEGTDPTLKNEFIIYSAHYDHVGIGKPDETGDVIYNGARDNAVGTTTVLSMAENLAKFPTKRSALFILFTGEEKGLLGSQFYVENPVLPLKKMVYCFNSDNAGYNDMSVISIIGLGRTTAAENIKKAANSFGLKAIDDSAPDQNLFDRSDNVVFAQKGIPAPTFSLGFTSFDGDVTKYYHQPGDEADTLDYDYLLKFFQSYVLAGRLIANDPANPQWTAGDKYEEAGKMLYGK